MRAAVLPHRDWLAANEARHRMRLAWADFFTRYDLLLCPVAAVAAFPHDQAGERHERTLMVNGRRAPVTDHLFWAGYTRRVAFALDRRALRLHAGRDFPSGVQIAGPQYGDLTCLAFARLLSASTSPSSRRQATLEAGVADRRGVVVPSIPIMRGKLCGSSARIVRSHG